VKEVNILKRWVINSEREKRRLNIVINIDEESKGREKEQRRKEV